MFNRIVAGVFAVCLVAGLRTDAAVSADTPNPAPKRSTGVSSQNTVLPVPAPVEVEPAAAKMNIGSAIDTSRAIEAGVSAAVLELALAASACAVSSGDIEAPPTLTLIDYSRPSVEPRLWVFDLATGDLLFKELVAHGKNTGDNLAKHFSNQMDSRQTSIGLFVTGDTYVGSNGYSLRLDGLDVGFNDRARDRAIVMHGAPYVNEQLAATQGRIGRSWGCPALRTAIAAKVIDTIRSGGVVFSYYPDQEWLQTSKFLKGCGNS